ncbi:MAG: type II secretion system F family protein [Desulfobacteraceae bacterium]|nr:type II secretion system F family protein [Desulfobacteraceae bacterium]
MALYKYRALGAENDLREGVLEEIDKMAVARKLMLQGLRPLEIRPHREGGRSRLALSFKGFGQDKITKKDIEFFTKQVALLLNAGLSLDASLRVMKEHSHKPSFRDFTVQIERKLKEGKSFSQALADFPKHFSPMYVNMARAGEEGGILPAMLMRISEYQGAFQELKSFIISSSIYPLILLAVGFVAILILITTILPRFEVLFEGMGRDLPANVKLLMAISRLISHHFFIVFLLAVGIPGAIVSYLRTPSGKELRDRAMLRLPLLRGLVRDLETTRIFRTLEVLVNNGVHLATALKISSGVAGNRAYQRLLERATAALKEGRQIGQRLKSGGLLPDMAADLLSIGEESGRVGPVCGQIADHYENEVKVRIKRLLSLIEPSFILVIALVAGYVVFSMLSVILSINDIAG